MSNQLLFAIDANTQEVIVSDSPKGSNQIIFIERKSQKEFPLLYQAVVILTSLANDPDFDVAVFKAMDKVCQMLYNKSK